MNERIRKLALETDAWCDQNWDGHKFYKIRWEEKFAELIVRECAELAEVNRAEDMGWNIGEIIKEHFGVE